jgi:hypothetical protein
VEFVQFNAPPDQTVPIHAQGQGKLHPLNGALMTSPADVVWDVLANVSGLEFPYSRVTQFKNACARLGISIGGSVTDDSQTIQSVIREIATSIGATFCADSFTLLQIWPGGPIGAQREVLDKRFKLEGSSDVSDVVNYVTYNFDYLNDNAQQSVQMSCPASISTYGKKDTSIDSKWVHDLNVAYGVVTRYLKQFARVNYRVTVSGIKTPLIVGDFVKLAHPVISCNQLLQVMARSRDLTADLTDVSLLVPVGPEPGVRLIGSSTAFTPLTFASLDLNTVGGNRIITLLNSDGSPIVNAAVTLDNETTRNTDASGTVSFPVSLMPPGDHLIYVSCQDGRTFSQTVTVS